jgi:hypothetical protein
VSMHASSLASCCEARNSSVQVEVKELNVVILQLSHGK